MTWDWLERIQSRCRFFRPRYVIDIETRGIDDEAMLAVLDRKKKTVELHRLENSS